MFSSGLLLVLFISLQLKYGWSTVICEQCHPIALQEAPGVGISLGFDHIAAALQFYDGTIVDARNFVSSNEYVQAMARLYKTTDSEPLPTSQTRIHNTFGDYLAMAEGLENLLKPIKEYLMPSWREKALPPTARYFSKEGLAPIVDALRSVFETLSAEHNLTNRYIYFDLPKFPNIESPTFQSLVSSLLHLSELKTYESGGSPQPQSALGGLYGLYNCFDEYYDNGIGDAGEFGDCDKYKGRRINNVLAIELSEKFFGLTNMPREDGIFYPDLWSIRSFPNQGTDSAGAGDRADTTYWTWLEEQLMHFIGDLDNAIDLLVLHGTQVTRPSLLRILETTFQSNPNIKVEDYLRNPSDHLYAAARSSARTAKMYGWDARGGCLYNKWCPMSEYMPTGLRWKNLSEDEHTMKSEL